MIFNRFFFVFFYILSFSIAAMDHDSKMRQWASESSVLRLTRAKSATDVLSIASSSDDDHRAAMRNALLRGGSLIDGLVPDSSLGSDGIDSDLEEDGVHCARAKAVLNRSHSSLFMMCEEGWLTYCNPLAKTTHPQLSRKQHYETLKDKWLPGVTGRSFEDIQQALGDDNYWEGEHQSEGSFQKIRVDRLEDGGYTLTVEDITERRHEEMQKVAEALVLGLRAAVNLVRDNITAGVSSSQADFNLETLSREELIALLRAKGEQSVQALTQIDLISSIVDLESGEIPIDPIPFDVQQNMGVVQEELRKPFKLVIDPGLKLHMDTGIFSVDASKVRKVLRWVIASACESQSNPEDVDVVVRAYLDGRNANSPAFCFDITDNGVPYSDERKKVMFQAYEHILTEMKTRVLPKADLFVAHQMAERLGGGLTVENPEEGNKFVFTVPMQWVAGVVPSLDPKEVLGGKKVLVVEDNSVNLMTATHILQKQGAVVTQAVNGALGLECAKSQEFDFILMDLQMPVMDGLTATEKIIKAGVTTPIIVLTANNELSVISQCMKAGAIGFARKPFRKEVVTAEVVRVFGLLANSE